MLLYRPSLERKARHPRLNRRHPLTRHLAIATWFTEGGGTSLTDLMRRRRGTIVPGTGDWIRTERGTAFDFDGSGYVTYGDDDRLDFSHTQPWSVAGWVQATDASASQIGYMVSKMESSGNFRGWGILLRGTSAGGLESVIQVIIRNVNSTNHLGVKSQIGFGITTANVWYHIAVTYNGNNAPTVASDSVRLWVNGVEDTSLVLVENNLTASPANSIDFNIGSRNNGNNSLDGFIDQLQVWRGYQLTQRDVNELYFTPNTLIAPRQFLPAMVGVEAAGVQPAPYYYQYLQGAA